VFGIFWVPQPVGRQFHGEEHHRIFRSTDVIYIIHPRRNSGSGDKKEDLSVGVKVP
jgi:hypothetical protein